MYLNISIFSPLFDKFRFSRTGVQLKLPHQFCGFFPNIDLDGESWFGRGSHTQSQHFFIESSNVGMIFFRYYLLSSFSCRAVAVVIASYNDSRHRRTLFIGRFIAFDQPDVTSQYKYKERYQQIFQYVTVDHPFIESFTFISITCEPY